MPERGAPPNVHPIQRRVLRALGSLSSPLLPDDYLEMINPLWSTRELRGRVKRVKRETPDAATILIKPGYRWPGHQPGQYLRIGVDIDGVRYWRAYSLTSDPMNPDGLISVTVKHVDEGEVSPFLVREAKPGTIVSLGGVETLIEQPSIMSYFELGPEELAAIGIDPSLIRLSVGIEETEDVLRDVLTALEKA